MKSYKPNSYNAVSPYFVVDDAGKMIEFLQTVFDAKELRRYDQPDGRLIHGEFQVDDSVIMMGSSSDDYPPNQLLVHVYVADADGTFNKAVDAGCKPIEQPKENEGDPDRRGMFMDYFGNTWAVSTQKQG